MLIGWRTGSSGAEAGQTVFPPAVHVIGGRPWLAARLSPALAAWLASGDNGVRRIGSMGVPLRTARPARKLAAPGRLTPPWGESSSWQFLLLVLALADRWVGVTLLLLTGVVAPAQPDIRSARRLCRAFS